MRARRLDDVPGFGIDKVAAAAGNDPDVLRLENLDTDSPPPADARNATQKRMGGGGEDAGQVPFATQIAARRHRSVRFDRDHMRAPRGVDMVHQRRPIIKAVVQP